MQEMLRSNLWTGLRDEKLRNATQHKYDLLKDYDELAIRRTEQESPAEKVKVKAHSIQKSKEEEGFKKQESKDDKATQELLKDFSTGYRRLKLTLRSLSNRKHKRITDSNGDKVQGQDIRAEDIPSDRTLE